MGKLKKARNKKDWEDEVYSKSTLKWYRLAKMVQGLRDM